MENCLHRGQRSCTLLIDSSWSSEGRVRTKWWTALYESFDASLLHLTQPPDWVIGFFFWHLVTVHELHSPRIEDGLDGILAHSNHTKKNCYLNQMSTTSLPANWGKTIWACHHSSTLYKLKLFKRCMKSGAPLTLIYIMDISLCYSYKPTSHLTMALAMI